MKISVNILLAVLALVFSYALPYQTLADGGGGGNSTIQRVDQDIARANRAIKAKDWKRAVEILTAKVARDDRNAEAYNLLGYSERMQGDLDAAFANYDRALALDPEHRGAHEYIGEAYLLTGNLPKAEEHLAALDKLCFFSCEQYRDLKEAIAEYKEKHPQ